MREELKLSAVRKYLMALSGLFLCLFLVGHLVGNLQLLETSYEARLQFNSYAVFMNKSPFIKVLSLLTYASVALHAFIGLALYWKNRKVRPVRYYYNDPGASSSWYSRNMPLLGILVLGFLLFHLSDFWYSYKFGETPYMRTQDGKGVILENGHAAYGVEVREGVAYAGDMPVGRVMKDLYQEVVQTFSEPVAVFVYLLGLGALGFHLLHGFQSAFQSLGLMCGSYARLIRLFGTVFAISVPLVFALIPVYVFFRSLMGGG